MRPLIRWRPSTPWPVLVPDRGVEGQRRNGRMRDQLVTRPVVDLVVTEQLLVELLARSQPGEDDRDVTLGLGDQATGHVVDAHRFAHVEDEHLTAAPIAPAWMTSRTASGIVMKNRVTSGSVTVTGPPRSIWLRNVVEHASSRSEDVAEPHRDVRPFGVASPTCAVRRSATRFE